MEPQDIIEKLLYLDNGFISSYYELVTGKSSETKITRTEGFNASVNIPLFGGGASSVESRTYSVSTGKMLLETYERLIKYPNFLNKDVDFGLPPLIRWIQGSLSIFSVIVRREEYTVTLIGKPKGTEQPKGEKIIGEETYFGIHTLDGLKFALVTSADYFVEGLDVFAKLNNTVLNRIDIPVNALIRIFPAASSFEEWISCPLVILARDVC